MMALIYTKAGTDTAISDYLAAHPVDAPVTSVNGETGAVVLDAADVGADPAGTAQGLVDAVELLPGPQGPAGAPGDPGPKGDPGDPGPAGTTTWAGITDKPATFPPLAHQHSVSDLTDYTPGAGGASGVTVTDTPAAPAEGEAMSYFVTSAVTWPAGLVWSVEPDGGVAPGVLGTALVSMFTSGGITRAILGATFPAVVAPDTTAPSTVTGLTATATGPTTVNLAWSAATDNVGVTGYEYRIDGGAAVDAGAGTTETITGLTEGTEYDFEVRAYDSAGNRSAAWSAAASATTTAPDTTPPVWTATLTPGTPTQTSVVVAASALATDASAITYESTLDSTAGTPAWAAIIPSGLNFTLTGLTAGTVYSKAALRAKDSAGNISTPALAVPSFTTGAAASSAIATAITALSPVGYWKLDETSGTQAIDHSGNNRHGTYAGSYTQASRDGLLSLAGGYVEIPDDDAWTPDGATGFTVLALTYVASVTATTQHMVAKGRDGQYEWTMTCLPEAGSGRLGMTWWGPTGTNHQGETGASNSLPVGAWHVAAFTITSATQGARVPLYVDSSTAIASNKEAEGVGAPANGSAALRIGQRADNAGPMSGSIGHVAIFRYALSATQIGQIVTAAQSDGFLA